MHSLAALALALVVCGCGRVPLDLGASVDGTVKSGAGAGATAVLALLARAPRRNTGRRRSVHRSICRRRGPTTADRRSRRRPSPAGAAATPIVQRVSMGAACCPASALAAASMTRVARTRTVRRGRLAPAIRCCSVTRVFLRAAASTPTAAWPDSAGPSFMRARMRSTNTAAIRPPINVWPIRIVPRASRASPFLESRGCANRPRSVANGQRGRCDSQRERARERIEGECTDDSTRASCRMSGELRGSFDELTPVPHLFHETRLKRNETSQVAFVVSRLPNLSHIATPGASFALAQPLPFSSRRARTALDAERSRRCSQPARFDGARGIPFVAFARHRIRGAILDVRRICEIARTPIIGPHGLRGTHATLAVQAGVTGDAVAAALGHESFDVTAATMPSRKLSPAPERTQIEVDLDLRKFRGSSVPKKDAA